MLQITIGWHVLISTDVIGWNLLMFADTIGWHVLISADTIGVPFAYIKLFVLILYRDYGI